MTDDYEKYTSNPESGDENNNSGTPAGDNPDNSAQTSSSSANEQSADSNANTQHVNAEYEGNGFNKNNSYTSGEYSYKGDPSKQQSNPYSTPNQNGYTPYGAPNYNNYQNPQNNNYSNPYTASNAPGCQPQYQPPQKKKNTGKKVFFGILIGILAIIVAAIILTAVTGKSTDLNSKNKKESVTNNEVGSLEISDSASSSSPANEVYKKIVKSNVGLLVYANNKLSTEGSGVIAKEGDDGYTYIITCAHVIQNGSKIVVQTYDKEEYDAEIVGYDTRSDLGVLKIKKTGLDCASFGDSDKLEVGQTVYAIGNPQGSQFAGSFTSGMISAIDRPVSSSTGYEMKCIQHTAAINPGNSGGALVNDKGEVIGINSMKIASTDTEGMGFSVPSSVVKEIFDSIVANGYVTGRAKLGITYAAAVNYDQYSMYVNIKGLPSGSIVIASISDDSALKDTKAQVGDLIVGVNGKDMDSTGMLAEMMEDMKAGDKLTLNIVRINTQNWSQETFDITVTLVEDRGNTTVNNNDSQDNNESDNGGSFGSSDDLERYFEEYFKKYYGNGN